MQDIESLGHFGKNNVSAILNFIIHVYGIFFIYLIKFVTEKSSILDFFKYFQVCPFLSYIFSIRYGLMCPQMTHLKDLRDVPKEHWLLFQSSQVQKF